MSDQSESLVPDPPTPSIHHEPVATVEKQPDYEGLYKHALRMLAGALEAMHTQGIRLDTFQTDMSTPAEWDRVGRSYNVWRRPSAPMGS